MSGIEFWGGEVSGQATEGKTSGAGQVLAAWRRVALDGRKTGVAVIDFDPKNPWRGQALTFAEYTAHGGRCPAPSICACQPLAR